MLQLIEATGSPQEVLVHRLADEYCIKVPHADDTEARGIEAIRIVPVVNGVLAANPVTECITGTPLLRMFKNNIIGKVIPRASCDFAGPED